MLEEVPTGECNNHEEFLILNSNNRFFSLIGIQHG
jgi:hypothetical protein